MKKKMGACVKFINIVKKIMDVKRLIIRD